MRGARRLGYVPALDGIRGIAIAAVTGLHFFGLSGGSFGVDLFFVLSGFLITTLLLEERERWGRISLRGFYERRARRLLPAVGVVVMMYLVFAAVSPARFGHAAAIAAAGGLYASNFVRGFAHPDPLNGQPFDHLWSLAEEEQFYLAWPLMLIWLLHRRAQRIALGLGILFIALVGYRAGLGFAGAGWPRLKYAPDTHADGLVLGCLLAFLPRRIPAWAGWLALAIFAACCVVGGQSVAWLVYGLPVVELASAALIIAALQPGRLAQLLSLRPLVWLGVISYSLYLWQQPARWLIGWNNPWPALALTVVFTLFSYYRIEKPFRQRRVRSVRGREAPQDETPIVVAVHALE
jgi:peptidoglycan/LPS O-acetylase OafA/YrhL